MCVGGGVYVGVRVGDAVSWVTADCLSCCSRLQQSALVAFTLLPALTSQASAQWSAIPDLRHPELRVQRANPTTCQPPSTTGVPTCIRPRSLIRGRQAQLLMTADPRGCR